MVKDLRLKIESVLNLINNNNKRIFKTLLNKSNNHIAVAEKADYGLSKRESEVVDLIIQGHQNKEIAAKLFISENTVAKHIKNIFEKTSVKNRTALVGLLR